MNHLKLVINRGLADKRYFSSEMGLVWDVGNILVSVSGSWKCGSFREKGPLSLLLTQVR